MNKFIRTIFFFFSIVILFPILSFGEIKTVTVRWQIPPANDIIGYKLHYSYNSDMSAKIVAYESNDPQIAEISCPINIIDTPIFFTIDALKSDNTTSSSFPKGVCYPDNPIKVQGLNIK